MAYKRVLAAVDFSDVTSRICSQGSEMARLSGGTMTLIHVVEPFIVDPIYDVLPAIPMELELKQLENVRRELHRLGALHGVPPDRCRVESGYTKAEILRVAVELSTDLIVLGSHGRHGVGLLLGSTTSAVLHSAPCDVLAIRMTKQK